MVKNNSFNKFISRLLNTYIVLIFMYLTVAVLILVDIFLYKYNHHPIIYFTQSIIIIMIKYLSTYYTLSDPKPKFIIDNMICLIHKHIVPGDIILASNNNNLANLFISSEFKHAYIYLGNNKIITSSSKGIIKTDIEYELNYNTKILIVRPENIKIRELVSYANSLVQIDLTNNCSDNKINHNIHRIYSTELVYNIFSHVYTNFKSEVKSLDKNDPNIFVNSSFFKKILFFDTNNPKHIIKLYNSKSVLYLTDIIKSIHNAIYYSKYINFFPKNNTLCKDLSDTNQKYIIHKDNVCLHNNINNISSFDIFFPSKYFQNFSSDLKLSKIDYFKYKFNLYNPNKHLFKHLFVDVIYSFFYRSFLRIYFIYKKQSFFY
jgi:hypothetical protein